MRNELTVNAKNIKKFRLAKGMKASDLAKMVGVSRQSISAYEKGIQFPVGCVEDIAAILGVTPQDLICFRDGEKS